MQPALTNQYTAAKAEEHGFAVFLNFQARDHVNAVHLALKYAQENGYDLAGVRVYYYPGNGSQVMLDIQACLPDWYCPAHLMGMSEGGPCPECERLGQRELDMCKRIHPATNLHFLTYYVGVNRRQAVNRRHTLLQIINHGWVLGRDQTLLDCIGQGFSLCVAKPLIDQIHGELDRSYAEYEAECLANMLGESKDQTEVCGVFSEKDFTDLGKPAQ